MSQSPNLLCTSFNYKSVQHQSFDQSSMDQLTWLATSSKNALLKNVSLLRNWAIFSNRSLLEEPRQQSNGTDFKTQTNDPYIFLWVKNFLVMHFQWHGKLHELPYWNDNSQQDRAGINPTNWHQTGLWSHDAQWQVEWLDTIELFMLIFSN